MHIVVYSGGMDSFTLLHRVIAEVGASNVLALSFNYRQRHAKELAFAMAETHRLGLPHKIIDLASVVPSLTGSALTDPAVPVPHGHYAEESMRKTVVPGRNTFMLSLAMAVAEGISFDQGGSFPHYVHYGAHGGDHHIYPDCRPEFVHAMQRVYEQATEGKVRLIVPYLFDDKTKILQDGRDNFGLTANDYARTWTCYEGGEHACGKCGSCTERAEAFAALGWEDPALAWKKVPPSRIE